MGAWNWIKGSPKPTENWEGLGHNWSYDWCRFRKDSRCMYPLTINDEATKFEKYPVWVPVDRGYCPRTTWEMQKDCPAPSEPVRMSLAVNRTPPPRMSRVDSAAARRT